MAISVKEPWASQIVRGEKPIEYRTWLVQNQTILIVSSRTPSGESGPIVAPLGSALCLVDVRCVKQGEGEYEWHLSNVRRVPVQAVKGCAKLYPVDLRMDGDVTPAAVKAEPEPVRGSMVAIGGKTYPVKDQLRAMGGRWDTGASVWRVPAEKADEARKLVAGVTPAYPQGPRGLPYGWRPCGYPGCNPQLCDDCDGKGAPAFRRY